MNINRATISALGTTGVLLAASLTMLALVSALVTFDGWPRGVGASSVKGVPVQTAPPPRLVRAVKNSPAGGASRAQARRSGTAAGGSAGPAGSRLAVRGAGGGSNVTAPQPQVPVQPPGEGDGGGPTRFIRTGGGRQNNSPGQGKGPVGQAACTAGQAVAGAAPATGAAVGSACKIVPSAVTLVAGESLVAKALR
ncbi:MAG: hypothetical protein QOD53_1775 [Thermoleophilaceae bacterium]|jgi:hypothetical protein|nr:hypothetical protein [Thermoleophilaceae bacterium]